MRIWPIFFALNHSYNLNTLFIMNSYHTSLKIGLLLIMAMVAVPALSFAQGELSRTQLQDMTRSSGTITEKGATETTGSPYLSKDFLAGTLYLDNGTQTDTIALRYDMENDQIEFLREGEVYILAPEKLRQFAIYGQDRDLTFRNGFKLPDTSADKHSMLRVVYDGEQLKLLARHRAVLHEDLATYGSATQKNRYQVYRRYYLAGPGAQLRRVRLTEQDLLPLLPCAQDELRTLIGERSLQLQREEELRVVLEHCEEQPE